MHCRRGMEPRVMGLQQDICISTFLQPNGVVGLGLRIMEPLQKHARIADFSSVEPQVPRDVHAHHEAVAPYHVATFRNDWCGGTRASVRQNTFSAFESCATNRWGGTRASRGRCWRRRWWRA